MKKILFSLLIAFGLLTVSSPAFALSCKNGQAGNSDECWTEVKVSNRETNVVSAGAILVYDMNTDSADRNAFEVVLATASQDSFFVAGVAQRRIATGDTDMVLVRGKGVINVITTVSTGDRLYVSSSEGHAGKLFGNGSGTTVVSTDPIGFALETDTSGAPGATVDAYITIL